MIAPVFVDTNVLVYSCHAAEPSKQARAAQWLDHLWREQLGRTSAQVLSEYYVTLTRKIKPALAADAAWNEVQALLTWNPQAIDVDLLVRARDIERRHQLSWWDSLIVGAAQLQGCAVLLSEDLQDGAIIGGVTVRNPFTLGVAEGVALYANASVANRPLQGRGRPRRVRLSPAAIA